MYDMVKNNILLFREQYPEFGKHVLQMIVETNGRYDGDNISYSLGSNSIFGLQDVQREKFGPMEFVSDNGQKKGIIKTFQRTQAYIFQTNSALHRKKLRIHKKVCSANPTSSISNILVEGSKELQRFRWADIDIENPRYSSGKIKATGKFKNKNDDMAVVILMLIYFSYMIVNKERIKRSYVSAYKKRKIEKRIV